MRARVLIAEDEENLRRLVAYYLAQEGMEVVEAGDGEQALRLFEEDPDFSLLITDIMMPGLDGYQLCRAVREHSQLPVLMLTAKDTEQDELQGFHCGADEYISKPFSPAILTQRVKSLLRRTGQNLAEELTVGAVCIRTRERAVLVNGRRMMLTPKEFDLLWYLAQNQGLVLSRQQIIQRIWGADYEGDDRTVDTHIKCLRAKLEEAGRQIITLRKVGYKLEVV